MAFPTEMHFIETTEARLGAKLPTSFRSYLLKSNGGEVEILDFAWEINPVQDTSDKERTRRTAIDIVHETLEARKWRGFPQDAVAIGDDGCGNHLVFLPSEHDHSMLKPDLYIWWHEGPELEQVSSDFALAVSDN